MAEFVQAALARRRVRVRIVKRPWPAFERAVDAGEADLFYLSWFADGPGAGRFLRAMVGSPAHGGDGNRTGYSNAAVDSLLDPGRLVRGSDPRREDLLEAETTALSEAPIVPLFHSVNVMLVRPWVQGFVPDPLGCPRYDTVEVRRAR
jgi:ABC-type oligopeptide transport system substrate-binding subunit